MNEENNQMYEKNDNLKLPQYINSWKNYQQQQNQNLSYQEKSESKQRKSYINITFMTIIKYATIFLLSVLIWFFYLFIIAIFIPIEEEISTIQGGIAYILAMITSSLIISKTWYNKNKNQRGKE